MGRGENILSQPRSMRINHVSLPFMAGESEAWSRHGIAQGGVSLDSLPLGAVDVFTL